jgi:hypothetical protein
MVARHLTVLYTSQNNDDGYFGNVGQNDFFDTAAKTPEELTEI